MTIKQQGGVFGRNPTFNNIDVDGSATFDGSTLVVDGVNNRVGINSPTPRDTLEFKGIARLYDYSGQDVFTRIFTDPSGKLYIDADKGNTKAASGIVFTVDNVEAAQFNSSGNLAFPAGQGIDFSATSGTGTSELFDDYEEGTWTPVYTASTTDPTFASYPVSSAHYRKIGAMVFVTARFRTSGYNSDGVGNLRISGLPYAAKSSGSFFDTGGITIHSVQNWGSIPYNGVVKPGDAFISLIGSTGFVDQSVLALGTGTNNNDISFSGMYVTD
jgi:hypothetical protein